jgi:hypothetical protein
MTKQSLLVILLLTLKSVSGQTSLTGTVIDNKTGDSILYASVKLQGNDTLSTVTNLDGYFSFDNVRKGKYYIKISAPYYAQLDTAINITENKRMTFRIECEMGKTKIRFTYNKQTALQDIKSNELFLLLPGGIVGTTINDIDTVFENLYKIKYLSRGCVRSGLDNETEYNRTVFTYLDKKYGTSWRKTVRQDTIGLRK